MSLPHFRLKSYNGRLVFIHNEVVAFKERNNPCLVSNQIHILERLEDIVPEHDFLLRLGFELGVDVDCRLRSGNRYGAG